MGRRIVRLAFWGVFGVVLFKLAAALNEFRDAVNETGTHIPAAQVEMDRLSARFRAEMQNRSHRDIQFSGLTAGMVSTGGPITMVRTAEPGGTVLIGGGYTPRYRSGGLRDGWQKSHIAWRSSDMPVRGGAGAVWWQENSVLISGGKAYSSETVGEKHEQLVGDYLLWTPLGTREKPEIVRFPMLQARADHSAVRLDESLAMIIGGVGSDGPRASVEQVHFATREVRAAPSMRHARSHFAAVKLRDGRVLAIGGLGIGGAALSSAEIFDPRSGQWTPAGSLRTARYGHRALQLPDGRVMIAGGWSGDPSGRVLDSVELWRPDANRWVTARPLLFPRHEPVLLPLEDGTVAAVGGGEAYVEVWNPESDHWRVLQYAISGVSGVPLDRRWLLLGGEAPMNPVQQEEPAVLDLTVERKVPTGFLSLGRREHAITALSGGRVLVTGGHQSKLLRTRTLRNDGDAPPDNVLNHVEIFDLAQDRSVTEGQLHYRRYGHQSFHLPDGRVAVVGGSTSYKTATGDLSTEPVTPLEIVDASTGLSSLARSIVDEGIGRHVAAQFPNGDLLLVVDGEGAAPTLPGASLYRWGWQNDALEKIGAIEGMSSADAVVMAGARQVLILGRNDDSGKTGLAVSWNLADRRARFLQPPPRSFKAWHIIDDAAHGRVGVLANDGAYSLDLLSGTWEDRTAWLKSLQEDDAYFAPGVYADLGQGRLLLDNIAKVRIHHSVQRGYANFFSGSTHSFPFDLPGAPMRSTVTLGNGQVLQVGAQYGIVRENEANTHLARVHSIKGPQSMGIDLGNIWRRLRIWWAAPKQS